MADTDFEVEGVVDSSSVLEELVQSGQVPSSEYLDELQKLPSSDPQTLEHCDSPEFGSRLAELADGPKGKLSRAYVKGGKIEQELIERLRNVQLELKGLEQGYRNHALEDLAISLVEDDLLQSQSKEVRILLACCLADVLRVFAPSAPYEEPMLKTIFVLFVRQLRGLEDVESPLWSFTYYLLEKLSLVKAFVMVADDEDIVTKTFENLYSAMQENQSYKVLTLVQNILVTIVEETTQPVQQWLLDVLLQPLVAGRDSGKDIAYSVLRRSTSILQSPVSNFLNSLLAQDSRLQTELVDYKEDLIVALNKVSSEFLLYVIPNLERELTSGVEANRRGAVAIMSRVFSEPDSSAVKDYPTLYKGFLRRATDIEPLIRKQTIAACRDIVEAHSWTATDILPALEGRLMDTSEEVRELAVETIFALNKLTKEETLAVASERMMDKHVGTRRKAVTCVLELLTETIKSWGGVVAPRELVDIDDVPVWAVQSSLRSAKALSKTADRRSLYPIERALFEESLVETESYETRVAIWLHVFDEIEEDQRELLRELLSSRELIRKRFRAAIKYRKRSILEAGDHALICSCAANDSSEILTDEEYGTALSVVAKHHPAIDGTESSSLKHLKTIFKAVDISVFDDLTTICDEQSSNEVVSAAAESVVAKFDKAQQARSFLVDQIIPWGREEIFSEDFLRTSASIATQPPKGMVPLRNFAEWFLGAAASVVPRSFEGISEAIADLLLTTPKPSTALQVLSSIGECFHIHGPRMSAVNKKLEEISLSSDYKDAKWAARALVQMNGDDASLPVWTQLLRSIERCLDVGEGDGPETVLGALTTLSQIASRSKSVWPLISTKAVEFSSRLLKGELEMTQTRKTKYAECCKRAMKILVHSARQSHEGNRSSAASTMQETLSLLLTVAESNGDVFNVHSGDEEASAEDPECARVRLASACGVLSLSRSLSPENFPMICPSNFLRTVLIAQDVHPDVRVSFAEKIYKGILHKRLQIRWMVGFILMAVDPDKENTDTVKKCTTNLVRIWRLKVEDFKKREGKNDIRKVLPMLPESVLPSVIWMLAHHPDAKVDEEKGFPDTKKYLEFFFSRLLVQSDYASFLHQILQTVVLSQDATDPLPEGDETLPTAYQRGAGTLMIRKVANLGITMLVDMQSGRKWDLTQFPGRFFLPEELFVTKQVSRTLLRAAKEMDKTQASSRLEKGPDPSASRRRAKKSFKAFEDEPVEPTHSAPVAQSKARERSSTYRDSGLEAPKNKDEGISARALRQIARNQDPEGVRLNRSSKELDDEKQQADVKSKSAGNEQMNETSEEPKTPFELPKARRSTRSRKRNIGFGGENQLEATPTSAPVRNTQQRGSHIEEDQEIPGLPTDTRSTPRRERKKPKRYEEDAEDGVTNSAKSSTGSALSRNSAAKAR
ncbi:hypothetical protein NDN08_008111 [Rhodosorus marinus]|uniref:Sister chromatid cohesion protein n=1 Tax=Rhodosorus marinus TaxID=101924 RepID=A0AAV8UZF4_9RHOD|nr:hypothetical protein NDN08_008111 [Rhodosorus marinus]